jgi:hypothetical protein
LAVHPHSRLTVPRPMTRHAVRRARRDTRGSASVGSILRARPRIQLDLDRG